MNDNYTQAAKERCFGLINKDMEKILRGFDAVLDNARVQDWGKTIQSIAEEYTFSSRFAIMRIVQEKYGEIVQDQHTENESTQENCPVAFCVELRNGTKLQFGNITPEHAKNLSNKELHEELQNYQAVLEEKASDQKDFDLRISRGLIKKALLIPPNNQTISRRDALKLGHALRFSLDEMEWFLLRTCDSEGGFHYNRSEDLIHAYGFLTRASNRDVQRIQGKYRECANLERTAQDVPSEVDWTLSQEYSLKEMVEYWSVNNHNTMEERFLDWMKEIAPYLGRNSQTALRIYRNLAAFAYYITTGKEFAPDADVKRRKHPLGKPRTEFFNTIRYILSLTDLSEEAKAILCKDNNIDDQCCEDVAKALTRQNAYYVEYTHDNYWRKAWASLKVNRKGTPQLHHAFILRHEPVIGKKRRVTRTYDRVGEILKGNMPVEKPDALYLIWFIAYQCWAMGGEEVPNADTVTTRIHDFCEIAESCLSAAGLPGFYPPHLMEQATLLSIACAYSRGNEPEVVYGKICAAI